MARKLASLGIILSMLCMQSAYAEPVVKPRIVVSIHSKYVHYIDHNTLYQYLSKVALFYPIYQGVYYIYIRPKKTVSSSKKHQKQKTLHKKTTKIGHKFKPIQGTLIPNIPL